MFVVLLQTFSRFVIEADYFFNKNYITKVLCINKAKPKMHCNGKCYLSRQLKEQEKQEQQIPDSRKINFEVAPFFLPKPFSLPNVYYSSIKVQYLPTVDVLSSTFLRSVFHPPTV